MVNCEEDVNTRIIISRASGPNDPMLISLIGIFSESCSLSDGDYNGPMGIYSDGSIEFYFKVGKEKYVFKATPDSQSETWPESTFTYVEGIIGKDGKVDSNCLGTI